jgi:hypothetical protein
MDTTRTLTFVVPDPPPFRARPGLAADRHSPHAAALATAGEAAVSENPASYPVRFTGSVIRFGTTMWNVDPLGYQPGHPLHEVLENVGAIVDPGSYWSYTSQDPDADFYVVTFTDGDGTSHGPAAPFAWSEVPSEFRFGR